MHPYKLQCSGNLRQCSGNLRSTQRHTRKKKLVKSLVLIKYVVYLHKPNMKTMEFITIEQLNEVNFLLLVFEVGIVSIVFEIIYLTIKDRKK